MFTAHTQPVYHNLKTSKATHVLITHFRASWLASPNRIILILELFMTIVCAEYFHGFAGKFVLLYCVVIREHFCSLARDD